MPSNSDSVKFEAWIDSVSVPLEEPEPIPNGQIGGSALKTINIVPGDHQLYLRVINQSNDLFWLSGVEYVFILFIFSHCARPNVILGSA